MHHQLPILFNNITEETLRREKLLCCENIEFIDEEELVNIITNVTIRVLCNDHLFTNHGFKVGELNQFFYSPNEDRYRWNETVLWVHETTLTTNSEIAKS